MNVDFIPIFYAAFSEQVTIAEVRPSLDDEVAIGEFLTLCDLKVFDFTVFSQSPRDKLDAFRHTRYDFIDQLEQEISKPVRVWDKIRQYIPTQIVAEYIREAFECDGVIYRSSMIREGSTDLRNISLFDRRYSFLGDEGAALSFVKHEIKVVKDVKYFIA